MRLNRARHLSEAMRNVHDRDGGRENGNDRSTAYRAAIRERRQADCCRDMQQHHGLA